MKNANKLKNNNRSVACNEVTTETTRANEVSFIMVAKGVLAFRESAHLIKIAEETV